MQKDNTYKVDNECETRTERCVTSTNIQYVNLLQDTSAQIFSKQRHSILCKSIEKQTSMNTDTGFFTYQSINFEEGVSSYHMYFGTFSFVFRG